MSPCLCGDTACGSCGPAQGYDPHFEKNIEKWDDELVTFLKKQNDAELSDLMESFEENDELHVLRYRAIEWAYQKWST